ncbi:hypothetical protein AYI69_g5696 [Smittium culicis]|uniref:Uncharacterized protein n=1 Tax=Smittium culicis TaxID=133412 RepID=A0A1R1Y4Q9_9FUNG|nr:hypothetical protein AYI69_g5696 [Smittium culicis]
MNYPIPLQNYPPEVVEAARVSIIKSTNRRTNMLLALYAFLIVSFTTFAIISLRQIISGQRGVFSFVFVILIFCFLAYNIYVAIQTIKDRKTRIQFFKHPGTDPYFIVNGIYPKNNFVISMHNQQRPENNYQYNPGSTTQHPQYHQ